MIASWLSPRAASLISSFSSDPSAPAPLQPAAKHGTINMHNAANVLDIVAACARPMPREEHHNARVFSCSRSSHAAKNGGPVGGAAKPGGQTRVVQAVDG